MPEGYTGHPTFAELAAFQGQKQIHDAYKKFDAIEGAFVTTASELPASGNWVGRSIYIQDVDQQAVWNGSAWRRFFPAYSEAAGRVNVTTANLFQTFPLPAGRFTVAPVVVAQVESGAGATVGVTWRVTNVTTTSFQIASSVATSYMWFAKQMQAGSASG